jgi:1,4-dihydroxy-2-naphthoate octaprenyltransferase
MPLREKIGAWVRLSRCPLVILSFISYGLGAAIAYTTSQRFDPRVYALGYICLLLIEVNTVFLNEYFDYPTDRLNQNIGPFNAGSRVLVEGKLGFDDVRRAVLLICGLIVVFGYLLIRAAPHVPLRYILSLAVVSIFFCWGYTTPPIKLSYRTLGEATDGLMHGPAAILAGFMLQTGDWANLLPWLLSIPTFLTTFVAATLGATPDYRADAAVARRTIPVVFGPRRAVILSIWVNALAAVACVTLWFFKLIPNPVGIAIVIVVPFVVIFDRGLLKLIKTDDYDHPINELMRLSLVYMILVGLIPLLAFIWG